MLIDSPQWRRLKVAWSFGENIHHFLFLHVLSCLRTFPFTHLLSFWSYHYRYFLCSTLNVRDQSIFPSSLKVFCCVCPMFTYSPVPSNEIVDSSLSIYVVFVVFFLSYTSFHSVMLVLYSFPFRVECKFHRIFISSVHWLVTVDVGENSLECLLYILLRTKPIPAYLPSFFMIMLCSRVCVCCSYNLDVNSLPLLWTSIPLVRNLCLLLCRVLRCTMCKVCVLVLLYRPYWQPSFCVLDLPLPPQPTRALSRFSRRKTGTWCCSMAWKRLATGLHCTLSHWWRLATMCCSICWSPSWWKASARRYVA